jgi:hypothetical protein
MLHLGDNTTSSPICEGHRNFLMTLGRGHIAGLEDNNLSFLKCKAEKFFCL